MSNPIEMTVYTVVGAIQNADASGGYRETPGIRGCHRTEGSPRSPIGPTLRELVRADEGLTFTIDEDQGITVD